MNWRYLFTDFVLVVLTLSCLTSYAQSKAVVPVISSEWWQIADNPDLGKYTTEKQQPVDFGIWQAAGGTWQLWSCIRHTACGGNTRLFYRWQADDLTEKNWQPMGIAMMADTTIGEKLGGLQAPFVIKENGTYYMFYGGWDRICLATSRDGKTFQRWKKNNPIPILISAKGIGWLSLR